MTRKALFYGWWVVILSSLINAVGLGISYYSFTVFFLPLKRDLGLSSAAVSLVYGAGRLEGGAEGPLVGYLIDKLGARRVILAGVLMAGVGYMVLSQLHNHLLLFLVYILVVSLGNNAGLYHPTSTAVNNWFVRRRGLALGVLTAAGSLGGVIMPPLMSYLVLAYNWRTAVLIAGGLLLAVAIPAGLAIQGTPEERRLRPDGDPQGTNPTRQGPPAAEAITSSDFSVKGALRTASYWLLTLSISLRVLVTVALAAHFVPILVWKGLDEAPAAYLVSLSALLTVPAMLAFGWLGDRWSKSRLCALGTLTTVAAMALLIFTEDAFALYFFPVALAITMGTVPLNWALIADFFGRTRYATLRGIMGIGYGTGTFASPIFAGWVFDRTESYSTVLLVFLAILLTAGLMFTVLRPPAPEPSVALEP